MSTTLEHLRRILKMGMEIIMQHFYMTATVTMVLLGIACVIFMAEKIVKSIKALTYDFVIEVMQEARKDAEQKE